MNVKKEFQKPKCSNNKAAMAAAADGITKEVDTEEDTEEDMGEADTTKGDTEDKAGEETKGDTEGEDGTREAMADTADKAKDGTKVHYSRRFLRNPTNRNIAQHGKKNSV